MIKSNLRLKALGLCAMVLGLMAFSASAAQAEPNARWMINGLNIVEKEPKAGVETTLLPAVGIAEIEGGSATLVTTIAGAKTEFLCTAADLTGAKLEKEGRITEGGKVKFSNCVTLLNGSLSKVCVPKGGGEAFGSILSDTGKGLIVLHENASKVKETLTRISPTRVDLRFALLEFGEECSLPEKVGVFGHLYIQDGASASAEKEFHLIKQGPLTKLWVISDTAEHAANIVGSAWAGLIGEHKGTGTPTKPAEPETKKFSALAG